VNRWLGGMALVALLLAAAAPGAGAQDRSASTPFDSTPNIPKTFPLIGGATGSSGDDTLRLVTAAAANDSLAVNGLLDAQVSPDEVEQYGRTPLIYAAMNNNAEIAQALVNRGAKLDVRDNLGKTALHWAAERASINVMRVLLQAKAPVDLQSRQGLTPLMLAASKGQTEAVRLLLQYHADPRLNDYAGRDAISWAGSHAGIVQALKVAAVR
jgi:uncharacterized protein